MQVAVMGFYECFGVGNRQHWGSGSECSCSELISSLCVLANLGIVLPPLVSQGSAHRTPAPLTLTADFCRAVLFLSDLALLLEVLLNNGRKWDYWEEFVCFANCKPSVCFFSLPYPPGHPRSSVFFFKAYCPWSWCFPSHCCLNAAVPRCPNIFVWRPWCKWPRSTCSGSV